MLLMASSTHSRPGLAMAVRRSVGVAMRRPAREDSKHISGTAPQLYTHIEVNRYRMTNTSLEGDHSWRPPGSGLVPPPTGPATPTAPAAAPRSPARSERTPPRTTGAAAAGIPTSPAARNSRRSRCSWQAPPPTDTTASNHATEQDPQRKRVHHDPADPDGQERRQLGQPRHRQAQPQRHQLHQETHTLGQRGLALVRTTAAGTNTEHRWRLGAGTARESPTTPCTRPASTPADPRPRNRTAKNPLIGSLTAATSREHRLRQHRGTRDTHSRARPFNPPASPESSYRVP